MLQDQVQQDSFKYVKKVGHYYSLTYMYTCFMQRDFRQQSQNGVTLSSHTKG